MGVFDPDLQKIVVRVVYDGPAGAGKTTNLQQICGFFTARRRGELLTPAERAGRTLFFDWLDLDSGLVGGYPLRCQLVSVPGQAVLGRRRLRILRDADAVVFVCDSSQTGLEIGRTMLHAARQGGRRTDGSAVPLVVQANKQDLPGRLCVEDVRRGLGLPASVHVTSACAEDGIGVRETLVLAIRAAANFMQQALLERGAEGIAGVAEASEDVYRALVELSAEEPIGSRAVEALRALKPGASAHERALPLPAASGEVADLTVVPRAGSCLAEESMNTPVELQPAADPPLPGVDSAMGHVWPAPSGREVLRSLSAVEPFLRTDLVGRHGTSDGSGASDGIIYKWGDWCLKTSPRRRYSDSDEARAAMLLLARRKTMLGTFTPPRTVLCLSSGTADAVWLWTLTPWLTTLRGWMAGAEAAGDEISLKRALLAYAGGALRALGVASRNGLVLDVHPSNFAVSGDAVVYLDDDVAVGNRVPAIGHALLRRVEEYEHRVSAVAEYVGALARGLSADLTCEERERLELRAALDQALVRTDTARHARRTLVAAVEQGR